MSTEAPLTGVVVTAKRYLPCGCVYERQVTFCDPLPPGWAIKGTRELGMAMRLIPLTHRCPRSAKEV